MNTYAYVGGNPINTIDPLGLYWMMVDGAPQWVPDGSDGTTDPDNLSDLYPMPGTPVIDVEELADYLAALESGEYGDRLIENYAYTGAPSNTNCEDERDLSADFEDGVSRLTGGSDRLGIIYSETISGILAEFHDMPWRSDGINGWLRNGDQLNVFQPELSEGQVEALGTANAYLPPYTVDGERQGMQLALPAGATDEQISEELRASLGNLLTDEDIAALIASLPEERDGPILVDIYELYQEILTRYQTRLHSDERVWEAELAVNQRQAELEAFGEGFNCETEVPPPECDELHRLRSELSNAQSAYIDAVVEVNNEMIDAGMMTLMDADVNRRTQSLAARLFAGATVATIGALVPLTLEDAAFDAATYGLGRIRRIGPALERALERVRAGGRATLNWVRDISDDAVLRIRDFRRGRVPNAGAGDSFRPQQPLDANGYPIIRTNDRGSVQIQPNGSVTCGQHSCGMVLNTQGNPVAVDDLIRTHPVTSSAGTTMPDLQRLLHDNGINTVVRTRRTVSDLENMTAGGRPSIAMVQTGPTTYHYVVVDGVTTRGGQRVVAVRDPAGRPNGGVYYETVTSFESRFTGNVIQIRD